jgi:hypothetical protein
MASAAAPSPGAYGEHPGLLPAVLVPPAGAEAEAGRAGRSTRDWIVDGTCFVLAILIGVVLSAEDAARDDLPSWFLVVDGVAGLVACLALWAVGAGPSGSRSCCSRSRRSRRRRAAPG